MPETGIADAVRRHDLGRQQTAYPAIPASAAGLWIGGAIAVGAIILGIAGLAGHNAGQAAFGWIVGLVTGLIVAGVAGSNRTSAGARLVLFEHGLIYQGAEGPRAVFRWDTVTVLQNIVKHYQNGMYVKTTYAYTLTGPGERTMTFGGGFAMPQLWGPAIQQAVTRAQLPRALDAITAGGAVSFGDIRVDRDTVSAGARSVTWSRIQEIKVKRGYVSLKAEGQWWPLTRTAVRRIPNFFVFHALAEDLRAGRP